MASLVATFGEVMLRLNPPGFERLLQSPGLVATFGCGEANVAVSLAHFGLRSAYVTCLPKHAIGDAAVRALRADAVEWPAVMDDAAWLHVTGITPALGERAAAATKAAVAAAKRAGARVSVDLNFRRKLWSEAEAQATMKPLMKDVDVVIANEEDLQAVLGIAVAGADVSKGALEVAGYRDAAERVSRELGPR